MAPCIELNYSFIHGLLQSGSFYLPGHTPSSGKVIGQVITHIFCRPAVRVIGRWTKRQEGVASTAVAPGSVVLVVFIHEPRWTISSILRRDGQLFRS